MIFALIGIGFCLAVNTADAKPVKVDDAYIQAVDSGKTWIAGTDAVEMTLGWKNNSLHLLSFKNKLADPVYDYVNQQLSASPFILDTPFTEIQYNIDLKWKKHLLPGHTADPQADNIRINVSKGDMIGFSVGPHGDFRSDQTEWPMTVEYDTGESYSSTEDKDLNQGPIWFYYVHVPETGILVPADSIEYGENAKENVRIPDIMSPYRTHGIAVPHVGATMFHPSNEFDIVRAWAAPKDGTITVRGLAQHIRGNGDVDLSVMHIKNQPVITEFPAKSNWSFVSADAQKVNAGGRQAIQLDINFDGESLNVVYHLLVFPRTGILRQWVDITNTSKEEIKLNNPAPLSLTLRSDDTGSFKHHWLIGGNSLQDQGILHTSDVTESYKWEINGHKTDNYTPFTSLQRNEGQQDGWFFVQEYLGNWYFSVSNNDDKTIQADARISPGRIIIPAGKTIQLPIITIGVYKNDLEDMGERVYNWQYEYMWDYTHDDWYGRMLLEPPWPNDIRNLQENFTMRIANQDLRTIDDMRTTGMELLWDDAGWSENPNVWEPSREGPDFLHTQRYVAKSGMKWLLWFVGEPTPGLMDTKVGSWGDFQWRTDGQPHFTFEMEKDWHDRVTQFLKDHPRSSFHTTSGGSRYSHSFEPQRYADINMFIDPVRADQSNYYLSYLETPDKWMDVVPPLLARGKYMPDTSRQLLTMVPTWPRWAATSDDIEQLRQMCDIYRFITDKGVAGRWTYMLHPKVEGDLEIYYAQRISYDRKKSLIILKHRALNKITVYPKGLIPDHEYILGFDSTQQTTKRTGSDLMENGVTIEKQAPGELIYIGLPNRPGSGIDKELPKAPSRVVTRRENNIGHEGVGIYWSPGSDNNRISYYEVRRDSNILGKVSYGTNYFDYSAGWDPAAEYAVRTVDGDGNISRWMKAKRITDEPLTISALGGHFTEQGREGWTSETTTDNITYTPMNFLPPEKEPWGDAQGTGNQIGGVEGYWEGADTARTGRGWQQASTHAQCVRTWTAVQDGSIRITGRAMMEYYRRSQGGPLRVAILHNNQRVWPDNDWAIIAAGDIHGVSHDITLNVAKGDTIRFVLDKGTSPESDVICWMPLLVYTDTKAVDDDLSIVRILCGSSKPLIDSYGNTWSADTYFTGGKPISTSASIDVPSYMVSDESLYKFGRQGKDFTYTIPVKPGLYTVRLKFAEQKYQWFFQRPFNLSINGRKFMRNSDICHSARSWRRAHDRVFRCIIPDGEGNIVLHFTGGFDPLQKSNEAIIQAIEILPDVKPVIRVDVGSQTQYIDWNSCIWDADSNIQDTQIITSQNPVSQATPTLHDQRLYQTARTGKEMTYTFTVKPGLYTVQLKFAELWLTEPGLRPMNIEVNNRLVWKDWDPAAAANQINMAANIRVDDVAPDIDGHITIRVSSTGQNDAILQGIEIE